MNHGHGTIEKASGESLVLVGNPNVGKSVIFGALTGRDEAVSALQVMDSKNLRRSLLITLQLIEMGLPITLALNMYDEAGERGIKIDTEGLAKALGLKVIPTLATQRWNLEKLEAASP